jgi:hypothetical protein
MTPSSLIFAAAALVPAMTAPSEGAPQVSTGAALAVALCNGGTLSLPLGSGAPPATAPCCAKGFPGSDKRKRIDRKQ